MTSPPPAPEGELRRDLFRAEWVIMAPGRANRPRSARAAQHLDAAADGPFLPGREAQTPPELLALRPPGSIPDGPGWRLRVVPNLFPALTAQGMAPPAVRSPGPGKALPPNGAHEVVIEDPDAAADLATLPVCRVAEVLWAWRERLMVLSRDAMHRTGTVFRHRGTAAGASQAHPHSQVLALPWVPAVLQSEVDAVLAHHHATSRCALCDTMAQERALGVRVVTEVDGALAWVPYAARVAFEVVVAPTRHSPRLDDASDQDLQPMAHALHQALGQVERELHAPPSRLWVRGLPWRMTATAEQAFHWHVVVVPMRGRTGALEESTGVYINANWPEDAAARLRGVASVAPGPSAQGVLRRPG